jgi:hypothetical protein
MHPRSLGFLGGFKLPFTLWPDLPLAFSMRDWSVSASGLCSKLSREVYVLKQIVIWLRHFSLSFSSPTTGAKRGSVSLGLWAEGMLLSASSSPMPPLLGRLRFRQGAPALPGSLAAAGAAISARGRGTHLSRCPWIVLSLQPHCCYHDASGHC